MQIKSSHKNISSHTTPKKTLLKKKKKQTSVPLCLITNTALQKLGKNMIINHPPITTLHSLLNHNGTPPPLKRVCIGITFPPEHTPSDGLSGKTYRKTADFSHCRTNDCLKLKAVGLDRDLYNLPK